MGSKIDSLDLRRAWTGQTPSVDLFYRETPYGRVPTAVRQQFQNASVSGNAGAMGVGDRGSGNTLPYFTDNPYTSNDYVYRWRQYVMLYETSWEARKIVRIVPEDALRKDWKVEGIPVEMSEKILSKLHKMQFTAILKRSLMLERLLGGCLTFLGIEDTEDDPARPYHPKRGAAVRFANAIPVSRIARVSWDFNPLSEGYMRPEHYMVNGQDVHVSRCLVWDGEPLFDPYDFALTNFRANLAGFGPSKLASVWDDIVKAIGTRQAAYQLIQTNNAILAAISDLQDLEGTNPGQKALQKIKDMANQLSVYRAAVFDSEKVQLSQHAASFGSVPELIITFIQVLAAASDIPATRFIGQAPGGLNATGQSDLENYYNVIDAYQRQRIEPQLRRMYDLIGYNLFPQRWPTEREKLAFIFPPLWNTSELEEAQRNTANIDNVLKLLNDNVISEEKAIEELNAKGALSVKLDDADLQLLLDSRDEPEPVDPRAEIERIKSGETV